MSAAPAPPNAATRAQHAASDPQSSVWLSANAGSGKTRVLTDRVARHLLRGVAPERILCLTYTKAAASEMQNRLFASLGRWSMLPKAELHAALTGLGVPTEALSPELLSRARTLFARAIETPGGLKIQTIHSFCSGLLRRFPMEAGLPPQFRELDEPATRELRRSVLIDMAGSSDAPLLEGMASVVAETDFDSLLSEATSHATALRDPDAEARLAEALGLRPGDTEQALVAQTILPGDSDLLLRLCPALEGGGKTDQKNAEKLRALLAGPQDVTFLAGLEGLFLTGASAATPFSAKIPGFPSKALRDALGTDEAPLNALMQRIEGAREGRLALALMARNQTMLGFLRAYLDRLARAKTARGVLDFDDLILQARALLSDPGVAQWVLFRLDGGIDHILVDEAQDTSPAQWDVISLLAQEFTAGEGAAADRERTIFVVGDPKQSIYSFQGADPRGFDKMRAYFAQALAQVNAPFGEHALSFSFRSSPGILAFVDRCFEVAGHSGLGQQSEHRAFRTEMPGRVDLWPALPKPDTPDKPPWYDPVDVQDVNDPKLELGRRVAQRVKAILDAGTRITNAKGEERPVRPADFLILVQSRSALFHEVIRTCKTLDIPIAGADRLEVGAELAVRDLMACLSFLATPEDDLALACVLKSPLFNWSEAQLYALAQPRGAAFLWQALRNAEEDHPETVRILRDLRDRADFLRPYELLERLLIRHGGRAKLLARLGHEVEDAIDALLAQAMAYERANVPSLTGFLSWFLSDDLSIKRQIDNNRDEVRVMTVHGAKGLEAPIVILPDCAKTTDRSHRNKLLALAGGETTLRPAQKVAPQAARLAAQAVRDAALEERMRLFYVAMTRAESWLMIAAAGETGTDLDSWHAIASAAMDRSGAQVAPLETPTGLGRRLSVRDWPAPGEVMPDGGDTREKPLILPALEAPDHALEPVAPSALGGAKVLASAAEGLDKDAAMARGTHIHLLLEHLAQAPPGEWPALATHLLQGFVPDRAERDALLAEAARVLQAPELAPLFAPDTLAEVSVTAPLPGLKRPMLGTIDRLVIEDDRVLAVDFKTNAEVPRTPAEVPEGLLRQMGAYRAALAQIYPAHRIDTAIVWTRTASLMALDAEAVDAALGNADVNGGGA